jgi:hypothetical protein
LGFSPRANFTGMGFLTFPSMRITLPLNQMLALVARGLCDSQAVMMFLELCLWLHLWFPVVVVLRLLALKVGRGSLLCVIVHWNC